MKVNKEIDKDVEKYTKNFGNIEPTFSKIEKSAFENKNKFKIKRKKIDDSEEPSESVKEEKKEEKKIENKIEEKKEEKEKIKDEEKENDGKKEVKKQKEIPKRETKEKNKIPIVSKIKEKINKWKEEKKKEELDQEKYNPLDKITLQKIVDKNIRIEGYEFGDEKPNKKKERFKKEQKRQREKEEELRKMIEEKEKKVKEYEEKMKIHKDAKPEEYDKEDEEDMEGLKELQKVKDEAEKRIFNYKIQFKAPKEVKKSDIKPITKLYARKIKTDEDNISQTFKETDLEDIKEKKRENDSSIAEEDQKEAKYSEEEDEVSEMDEKPYDDKAMEELTKITLAYRKKQIEPRIGVLRPRRKIVFDNDAQGRKFNELINRMDIDELAFDYDKIFIPSSQAVVDGKTYDFLGAFLDEFASGFYDAMRYVNGLNKAGFEIPESLYPYALGQEPVSFKTILNKNPGMFACYGPTYGNLAPFRKPNPLLKKGAINQRRVSFQELSQLLGNLPKEIKRDKYVNELLSLLYLGDTYGDEIPYSPNANLVFEALDKCADHCIREVERIRKDVREMVEDPAKFIRGLVPGALYYPPGERITLIDENQKISTIKSSYLGETIKTSFKVNPPDLIAVTILAQFVPNKLPQLAYDTIEKNYVGTGSVADIGLRYQKSLRIYFESNSEDCQKFHKKFYKEEFSNAMNYLGYSLDKDKKTKIPIDVNEFLAIESVDGSRLIGVNNHAMGTFTTKLKREDTSVAEIEAGLSHFHKLEEDPQNPSFQYFYYGFKKVAAKFKDEIHSFEKPPRFYNPTFIGAYIPFQFLFNYCFQFFEPFSEKCPFSLLGIKDIGTNFHDVMMDIYNNKHKRYHYSDNFWIKEDNLFVSVDVSRCDSNLSPEALSYPISYLASMVLSDKDLEKMLILAKMFRKTIPREAFFGISQGKDSFCYSFPFYWLPSGVVGTAYINHMFTGAFLYYTKDTKWINKDGSLTAELLEKAKTFGIHLEVASFIDFNAISEGDIVPFDLLARSGIFWEKEFIPILDHKRVWQALLFCKKGKYDRHALICNYVRLSKINSMINLGACLDPVIGQFIYSFLVYILSSIRKSFITLTKTQALLLLEELESFKITPENFTSEIFSGYIPDSESYIKNKTGKNIKYPPAMEFDEKIKEKIDLYAQVWASLGPVLEGVEKKDGEIFHKQFGTEPYFIVPYFFNFLRTVTYHKVNLNLVSKYLCRLFGDKLGIMLFKSFLSAIIKDYKSVFFKSFAKQLRKMLEISVDKLHEEKGVSKSKLKDIINEGLTAFFSDPELEHLHFSPPQDSNSSVGVTAKNRNMMMGFNIINNLDLDDIFGKFGDIWKPLMYTKFVQYVNYLMSYMLFEGIHWYDLAREKTLQKQAPPVNKYREMPIELYTRKMFDPTALKSEMMNFEIEGNEELADDLGMLKGLISGLMARYPDGKSVLKGNTLLFKLKDKGK